MSVPFICDHDIVWHVDKQAFGCSRCPHLWSVWTLKERCEALAKEVAELKGEVAQAAQIIGILEDIIRHRRLRSWL